VVAEPEAVDGPLLVTDADAALAGDELLVVALGELLTGRARPIISPERLAPSAIYDLKYRIAVVGAAFDSGRVVGGSSPECALRRTLAGSLAAQSPRCASFLGAYAALDRARQFLLAAGAEALPAAPLVVDALDAVPGLRYVPEADAYTLAQGPSGARVPAALNPGAVVRENRISAGAGFGIYADATEGTPIEENEVDHNSAGGVLVRSARNTTVRSNRIYANGYGIVVVFGSTASPNTVAGNVLLGQLEDGLYVVGGSPLMRANQVRGSRGSGLRILDFLWGRRPRVVADPFLEGNILTGNGSDVPRREEYRIDD